MTRDPKGEGGLVITYLAARTEHERNRGKCSTQLSRILKERKKRMNYSSEGRESRGRYLAGRIRNPHIVRS